MLLISQIFSNVYIQFLLYFQVQFETLENATRLHAIQLTIQCYQSHDESGERLTDNWRCHVDAKEEVKNFD
jgi:hypothetical protein